MWEMVINYDLKFGVLSSLILIDHDWSSFFAFSTLNDTHLLSFIQAPEKLHKKWTIMMNHWTITTYRQPWSSINDEETNRKRMKKDETGRIPIVHRPSASPTPSKMSHHEQPPTSVKHQQLCRESSCLSLCLIQHFVGWEYLSDSLLCFLHFSKGSQVS